MKKIKTLFRIFWLMLIMLALSGLNVLSSAWAADLYYNGSGSVADLGINPIQPGYTLRRVFTVGNAAVSTYTTMDCISLSLSVTQAYYDSYQANVSYRETGSSSWNSAHSLTRSEYDRARYPSEYWWYGSIVGLSAGVDYEIKIVIEPSGGGTAIAEGEFTVRTREEPGRGTILQTLYVSVSGNDSNAGTEQAPLRNIQTALNNAQPGTKVKVLAGTYNESLVINQNGTSENPIILEGGEGVVLDGHTEITAQWNLDGDALYYVSCSEYPSSIDTGSIGQTENRKRLYEYCASSYDVSDLDLDDLRNRAAEAEDLSVSWCPHYSILGGWYYDTVNSKLYVRAEGDNNLNNLSVWVGTPDTAITINGNYVIVEGFEIKYYKKAITASQKRFSIIRGNDIFRCQEGIYFLLLNNISGEDLTELPNWSEVGTAGSEYGHYAGCLNEGTIIEYNTVTDPDTYAWGYGRGKTKPTIETTGVQISGPGSIVRYNYVIGYFKGISASWDVSQTNRDLNRNLDMYNNVVCESTSDSFEPEGNLINVRIWGNKCRDMWTGVSIAPVRYGPMYVWKNIFIDHGLTAFKLSSSTTGYTYIYNNTVKTDVSGIPGWRNS
ncbi:DUF1565 domain-containing protein, partial [Candidatus Pacearchaeota archaeon]|nr:DUF1565 domain-containing protein [Candidatus Pacearchaeota archaeon]